MVSFFFFLVKIVCVPTAEIAMRAVAHHQQLVEWCSSASEYECDLHTALGNFNVNDDDASQVNSIQSSIHFC